MLEKVQQLYTTCHTGHFGIQSRVKIEIGMAIVESGPIKWIFYGRPASFVNCSSMCV